MIRADKFCFAYRAMSRAALAAFIPLAFQVFALPAQAQTETSPKSVVPEAVPAFTALNQWLTTYVMVLPASAAVVSPQVQPWQPSASPAQAFEPHPVIVGLPDLPLTGATLARAGQQWDGTLNYQGVHMSMLVVDKRGRLIQKPLSAAIAVGERFKIRITPTFDAVTELDQLVGDAWHSQRTGQSYPATGTSVAIKAGQTVDLPLGSNLFFAVDGRTPGERMVISVRDPKALRNAASEQPNYRQDHDSGSSFVQLVPSGQFAKVEQVISVRSN